MALIKVTQFETGSAKSGVSLGMGESKGRSFFRINLTEVAQKDLFGRAIDVRKEALKLVVNNNPRTRHLMGIGIVPSDDHEAIRLSSGPRGGVSCKVHLWSGPGGGKRASRSLDIINRHVGENLISVKLPEFAVPTKVHDAAARG